MLPAARNDRRSRPAAAVGAAGLLIVALLPTGASVADDNASRQTDRGFEVSYTAGERDAASHFMGGTELRNLSAHGGRLYAGNGYWKDQPGPEGPQPAQIFVLDSPAARWRVERSLDERMPNGHTPRHLAVSALQGMTFSTNHTGRMLSRAVSMLFAGTWDLSGASQIMSRNDVNGAWTAMSLPIARVTSGIQQVRALAMHRDRRTGVDQVFAGNDPHGIVGGGYDDAAVGIRWGAAPELDISRLSAPAFPGLSLLRVTSFAECNGILYATIGQQIYRRFDGAPPRWELFYTNPTPGYSETGLRGLTAIPNPSGSGQVLLVAVEGNAARIIRIDPATGGETTELDIPAFLSSTWATKVGYVIAAYNDMTVVSTSRGEAKVLIGIEAFLPAAAPVPSGHVRVDGGLDGGGWYFVRQGERRYDLRKIGSSQPLTGAPLVATRAIAASPFPNDTDMIYFAGFDANKRAAHNTAWIFRTGRAKAILSTSSQER